MKKRIPFISSSIQDDYTNRVTVGELRPTRKMMLNDSWAWNELPWSPQAKMLFGVIYVTDKPEFESFKERHQAMYQAFKTSMKRMWKQCRNFNHRQQMAEVYDKTTKAQSYDQAPLKVAS